MKKNCLSTAVIAVMLSIVWLIMSPVGGLHAADAIPLRILPLGDSITYGLSVAGGYRAPLYQLLTNAGYNLNFVGTQTGNGVASLPDSDHEGYSGWRIRQIDSIILNSLSAVPDPDIILLLLGTNDYGQNDDPANATNRLEALIARMATNRPKAKIIVANLLVRGEPYNTQIQTNFNPFLPGICDRQRALGRQVFFNDLRNAVPLSDMPDQLHPNQPGYNKMATNWFVAIQAVLCTNCPPRFIAQPTNQIVLPGTNVTLVASALGTGMIRYQWRFEGANIPNATNAVYSFTNASLSNGHGNFSVAASDDNGTTISTNALVFARINPGIVTHPVTTSVLQGENATFTCVATGAPPLFYRWIRSGVSVFTNTTGVGVFTNIQSTVINGIRCVVMNAAGSAIGSNVSLIMVPDFDGDGIADAWETQYGLNTNSAVDALSDLDDDRMSNRDEYTAGTDPRDPSSRLKIESLTRTGTNAVVLQFQTVSNRTYTVQFSSEATGGVWTNLTSFDARTTNATEWLTNSVPQNAARGFYRVVTPRQP